MCTTKKIAISDGQSSSQQHKKPSQISSVDGKRPSTSVGKSLVDNTILPTRPSLTLISDSKKPLLAIYFFRRKYFFIRGSWMTKYILWWTKAVINVFFSTAKSHHKYLFCRRKYNFVRGSWMTKYILRRTKAIVNVFFRWQKVVINTWFAVKNTISNDEVKRPNTFFRRTIATVNT